MPKNFTITYFNNIVGMEYHEYVNAEDRYEAEKVFKDLFDKLSHDERIAEQYRKYYSNYTIKSII